MDYKSINSLGKRQLNFDRVTTRQTLRMKIMDEEPKRDSISDGEFSTLAFRISFPLSIKLTYCLKLSERRIILPN